MVAKANIIITALAKAAQRWSDYDYPVRQDAVNRSLEADNRFTEAAVTFAVNQQMALLTEEALRSWQEQLGWDEKRTVGVLNPGNIPFVELQDFVGVVLSGASYIGSVSSKSPALFPAFLSDVIEIYPDLRADISDWEDVVESCDILIASGSDDTMLKVSEMADEASIVSEARWIRGHRFSVSVLGGRESKDDLVSLAEDALLHEGLGCRNTALIFAPAAMEIDPVLDCFATFRGTFAAHPATTGSLKMQQAFLKAVSTPHAFADDLQFLISRGEAEPQQPGHLRWVPYENLEEVTDWLNDHTSEIQCVFTSRKLQNIIAGAEIIGSAQRPTLTWAPDQMTHTAFFKHQTRKKGV